MATPKEQHDARSNARMIGTSHRRTPPADAMPSRAPSSSEHAIRGPAVHEPRRDEPSPSPRERRPSIGDPPRG